MSTEDKEEEEKFINPKKFEKLKAAQDAELAEQRKMLEDEETAKKEAKDLFYFKQRTEHVEIPPAKDRIIDFLWKPIPADDPKSKGPEAVVKRPHTTEIGTRFKSTGDYNKASAPNFKTFYTTSQPVVHHSANRIEGRSGYYIPSDNMVEQKLEKMWYQEVQRGISEKRTMEEMKQTM